MLNSKGLPLIWSDYGQKIKTRLFAISLCSKLCAIMRNPFFKIENHALNRDYGAHKNVGKSFCSGKYIFQLDADESPSLTLMENLKDILESNPTVELFWLPRINDFKGVTEEHAKKWGWRLDPYEDRQIVNFPDPQTRIFKNLPHIKWEKKLHERITGAKFVSHLPNEFEFSLIHNKTMEKQEATNLWYGKNFTASENGGT